MDLRVRLIELVGRRVVRRDAQELRSCRRCRTSRTPGASVAEVARRRRGPRRRPSTRRTSLGVAATIASYGLATSPRHDDEVGDAADLDAADASFERPSTLAAFFVAIVTSVLRRRGDCSSARRPTAFAKRISSSRFWLPPIDQSGASAIVTPASSAAGMFAVGSVERDVRRGRPRELHALRRHRRELGRRERGAVRDRRLRRVEAVRRRRHRAERRELAERVASMPSPQWIRNASVLPRAKSSHTPSAVAFDGGKIALVWILSCRGRSAPRRSIARATRSTPREVPGSPTMDVVPATSPLSSPHLSISQRRLPGRRCRRACSRTTRACLASRSRGTASRRASPRSAARSSTGCGSCRASTGASRRRRRCRRGCGCACR